ncbi:MAG: diacylglycerol kinase family protein [Chitinophagaceae bacterium]
MKAQKFSIRNRARSFQYAFSGLYRFLSTTHNAIIHAGATVVVIAVAVVIKLPLEKFLFVLAAIGMVWVAELFNTAIEHICDMISPQFHPRIKIIKDLSAAAVLVAALVAVVTACIIFIPAFL